VYFDQTKPKSAAQAIAKLLDNPDQARKLGEAGRKHAASFDWDKIAASVYERIKTSLTR
jgi:glycosyltransferase involved in cell wall biosynthesis